MRFILSPCGFWKNEFRSFSERTPSARTNIGTDCADKETSNTGAARRAGQNGIASDANAPAALMPQGLPLGGRTVAKGADKALLVAPEPLLAAEQIVNDVFPSA